MSDSAALIPAQGTDYAAALAASPVPNLRRIGGEMFNWSDSDPRRTPPRPRGAVLRHLLGTLAAPGQAVLVAGPTGDELVAALVDAGASVTWLLRSLGDAERAAVDHPAVTVIAGSVVKFDIADKFDLVVAVDGIERLNSAEGEQLSTAELLDRLVEAVRPEGVLLLMHDNHLGLHHTVRLEAGAREADDAAWYPLDDHDAQRPASREQLADRLAGAGLVVDVAYAAFPEPAAPTVLIGPDLLGNIDSPLRPRLGTVLSRALTFAYRGRPVLSDPRRLMRRALNAGAEDAVAPSWLVIARAPGAAAENPITAAPASGGESAVAAAAGSGGSPIAAAGSGGESATAAVPAAGGRRPVERHDLVVGDAHGAFTYEVTAADGEIRTTVLQPLDGPVERAGLRRIADPVATSADTGYVLEERLLHLCATHDLRGLRIELAQFDAWLRAQAVDGRLEGPVAVAGPADVFVTPDGPTLLPARWEPIEPVAYEIAVVRAFWEFGVQLITSAQPHPWAITSSAVDLANTMLGMVGRGATEEQIRAAAELQVALEAAEHGLTPAEQHDRLLALLAVQPGTAMVDIAGFRELEEALWRQRYQAGHLLAMMEWTETIIQSRDNSLSRMDREISFYRTTPVGKLVGAARLVYRRLRGRR
ncbi:hypothetical protein ACQP2F_02270 [Actinoplanes sp. CA-030573]|uniref:hypothetical protein n=1 Tax=Actinoplanes sp. CA-030573 TaxID=3239898 RepID=UPI003D94402C